MPKDIPPSKGTDRDSRDLILIAPIFRTPNLSLPGLLFSIFSALSRFSQSAFCFSSILLIKELPALAMVRNDFHSECSSSTSWSSQPDTEDDRMIALVLSEEYTKLDGAVARRLSNLAPVPVVPRINSYIPTINDANLDHQRLLQRLHVYGLFEVRVSGDGNCQFRALSDQLYNSPDYHKHVRKDVVKQLKEHRSLYESYVPMKYKHYYKKMAKSGEWGDHVTLQAAADKFAAKFCLLTSFRVTCFIEIVPQYETPRRELWLSFWSEVHYNSLYDIRDAPRPQKPRKKHWLF